MKILYFSQQHGPHDHRFLSAAAEGGHQVFFLCLETHSQKREKRTVPKGVKIVDGTIRDVISEVKPDLVHAGPLTTCGYLAAKTGFHPLVQMSWGSDILYAVHKSASARRRVGTSLHSADVLVADCAAVGDAAVKLGFPRKKIVTFPWGVDLKRFNPKGHHNGLRKRLGWQKSLVLLHVRSWESLYGAETVLRAFIKAAARQPSLRLLIPGSGSLAPRLKKLVQKSGLGNRVYFAGFVAQKDLPSYYRAADLYISASKSDGSSVSLMEALASGLPALVSDIPGNREWVRPGKEGWLFPLGNERKLADMMVAAVAESNRLQKMAKQARTTAIRRADWTKNKKLLFRAYQLALGGESQ